MIKFHESARLRPVTFVLWNSPSPKPLEVEAGDVLVGVENLWADGRWGWRYTLLRPVEEEEGEAEAA